MPYKPEPERSCWKNMVARCTKPEHAAWDNYGGRGITVCTRWLNFWNFLSDMGRRPEGHELDRVDNDGGYHPGNCRWATRTQNARNRRSSRIIEYAGRSMCLSAWAVYAGISVELLWWRLGQGWAIQAALAPANTRRGRARPPSLAPHLLLSLGQMIAAGVPHPEAAKRAGVSRSVAYKYFPVCVTAPA